MTQHRPRIALTGASSTGKTTLARTYLAMTTSPVLALINVDARSILRDMGATGVAKLSPQAYRRFQRRYIAQKAWSERHREGYLTERSFVDAYAFWTYHCEEAAPAHERAQVLRLCRAFTERYDMHIFLPYGIVPHSDDGYRHSEPAYHQSISNLILDFLKRWEVSFVTLEMPELSIRLDQFQKTVGSL